MKRDKISCLVLNNTSIHGDGPDRVSSTELVQGGTLGRSHTASTLGDTRPKAKGTDAVVHVMLGKGKGRDMIETTDGSGTADAGSGLDATQIATQTPQVADLVWVTPRRTSTVPGFAIQGQTTGVSNAEDILLSLATAHNIVTIESNIPAAASFEHASPGLPFWASGGGHDGCDLSRVCREQWFCER